MTWISVNESQPTNIRTHIAYCGRHPSGRPIYLAAIWDIANGVWRDDEGGLIATVKCWCEIPEPEAHS